MKSVVLSECTSARQRAWPTRRARLLPGRAEALRDELADPAGHQHVVAEELELVQQSLLQAGERRVGLHVQEVDLDAGLEQAVAVHLEERELHRVVVLVRRAVGGRVGLLERALVEVRS